MVCEYCLQQIGNIRERRGTRTFRFLWEGAVRFKKSENSIRIGNADAKTGHRRSSSRHAEGRVRRVVKRTIISPSVVGGGNGKKERRGKKKREKDTTSGMQFITCQTNVGYGPDACVQYYVGGQTKRYRRVARGPGEIARAASTTDDRDQRTPRAKICYTHTG